MEHPVHPLIVHFPIALLFTSVFFDLLGLVLGLAPERKNIHDTGFWLLILGWIGGLVAAIFGAWTEEAVEKAGVPEAAVDRHELFAVVALIVFALLIVVRWRARNRWSKNDRILYLSAAMAGLFLLGTAGFFGGELVYRYGAGVAPRLNAPPPAAP